MTLPTLTPAESAEIAEMMERWPELQVHDGDWLLCYIEDDGLPEHDRGWYWWTEAGETERVRDTEAHALIFTHCMVWLAKNGSKPRLEKVWPDGCSVAISGPWAFRRLGQAVHIASCLPRAAVRACVAVMEAAQ